MQMQGGAAAGGQAPNQPPAPPRGSAQPRAGGQMTMQPPTPPQGQGGMQMQGGAAAGGQAPNQPPAPPRGSAQPRAGGQMQGGAGAKITVEEQPAQINVEKRQPRIVVEQPAPAVSIQQPKPKVSVQQSQPQVQVREAKPQVSVQEQGQAQVEVRDTGAPVVTRQQPEQEQSQQMQQSAQPEQAQSRQMQQQAGQRQPASSQSAADASANPVYQQTVRQLKGTEIIDVSGKDLGEVDKVVMDRKTGQPHVVLSVGGFLGIGDETVALPLSSMTLVNDKLMIPGERDEEQLKRRPPYRPDDYVELQQNMTIASQIGRSAESQTRD